MDDLIYVIDDDKFLDMPISAQALYFHFVIKADEYGHVKNYKSIMRMINSSSSDLECLINKKYVSILPMGVTINGYR